MPSFFSMPQDVLTQIYAEVPPENLLRMLITGSPAVKNETLIRSLFMKKENKAQFCQEKVIQSWDQARGVYPFPFADRHVEFSRSLARLDVRYQIMGLFLMNQPAHTLQANRGQISDSKTDLVNHSSEIITPAPAKRIATDAEIRAHCSWVDFNLTNRNYNVSRKARQDLITLAQEIDSKYFPLLFALIQKKLESLNEYSKHYQTVLKALNILTPRLDETELTLFLTWIQKKLENLYESDEEEEYDDSDDEELVVHKRIWDEDFRHMNDAIYIATPWFRDTHLTNFLNWIQKELANDAMDFDVQQALAILAIRLPQEHLPKFFTWILTNLAHWNTTVQINAHEALTAVAPRLDKQSITPSLIDLIKEHLANNNDSLRQSTHRTLATLANKLSETHIATLLTWIEEKLKLGNNDIRNALQALTNIGSILDRKLLTTTLFKQIQDNLKSSNLTIRVSAQQALAALAPILDAEFITEGLLDTIRDNLQLQQNSLTISALEVIEALAPKLNALQLSPSLLSLIRDNTVSSQYLLKDGALNTLSALMPVLNEKQIDAFLEWIEDILESEDDRKKADALEALKIIVSGSNAIHFSPRLLSLIQSSLLGENHLALQAQEVLIQMMPKFDEPEILQFLDWMQNNLGERLKSEPYLGDLLACCAANDKHAIPIAKKLVDIINGKNKTDSEMAMNLLGQWSMSWIRYVDNTNKDTIQNLIASLQPDVHDKNKQYAPKKTWNMFARLSDHDVNPNPYLLSLLKEQLRQFVAKQAVTPAVASASMASS